MDARAALDYLYTRHDINHSKIILFGRSLGNVNLKYKIKMYLECIYFKSNFALPKVELLLLI